MGQRYTRHSVEPAGIAGTLVLAALLAAGPLRAAEFTAGRCYPVDLPAVTVAEALEGLARQTGAKILFAYDLAVGRRSHAVRGCLSVLEAMAVMLEGSGLVGARSENGAFTIYKDTVRGSQPTAVRRGRSGK